MKVFSEKRIPSKVLNALLYVSLCFGNWYYARRLFAYLSIVYYNSTAGVILGNAISAALILGLLLFAIISPQLIKAVHPRKLKGVDNSMLLYILRIFIIACNLIYGGISFSYFAFPPIAFYGDLVFKFLAYILAIVLAVCVAVRKNFIKKEFLGRTIYSIGGAFLLTYVLLMLAKILLYYTVGVI